MSTITQNVCSGVLGGGTGPRHLQDDAGERRGSLRFETCRAASRQDAAAG